MDSRDPMDHADYHSICEILTLLIDRKPMPAQLLGGRNCRHHSLILAKLHPFEIDGATSFGPRLLQWLISSQLLNPNLNGLKSSSLTDRYDVKHVLLCKQPLKERWVEIIELIYLVVGIYLLPLLNVVTDLHGGLTLGVMDLLKISVSIQDYNDIVSHLMNEYNNRAIPYNADHFRFIYDTKLKNLSNSSKVNESYKIQDLWGIPKMQLKTLQENVRQALTKMIGSTVQQTHLTKWLETAKSMIFDSCKIKSADKLKLGQFTAWLTAAVGELKPGKFKKYVNPPILDIVQMENKPTRCRIIYEPTMSIVPSQLIKIDSEKEAEPIEKLVEHKILIHTWKLKLHKIQLAAEQYNLLPIDMNLSNQQELKHTTTNINLQPPTTVTLTTTINQISKPTPLVDNNNNNNNNNNDEKLTRNLTSKPMPILTTLINNNNDEKLTK